MWPVAELLPVVVTLNLGLSSWVLVRDRGAVDRRLLLRQLLPLMGAGLPLGLLLQRLLAGPGLLVAFGLFVTGLSGLELARAWRRPAAAAPLGPGPRRALLLLGGVVHGLFATGGPMAVYVAGRELADKRAFRATLAALWLLLNLALLATWAATGALDRVVAERAALLVLPLLVGLGLGELAHARLPLVGFRLTVQGLLLLAGLRLALSAWGAE